MSGIGQAMRSAAVASVPTSSGRIAFNLMRPEDRGWPSRRIDVIGEPLEVVHVLKGDGGLEERGAFWIEHYGRPRAEGLREIALHHRIGVNGPFDPVIILETPDARELLGLIAVGLDGGQWRSLARPQPRELHRRVELDHIRRVDLESSVGVHFAQARENEVARDVECVQAAEP